MRSIFRYRVWHLLLLMALLAGVLAPLAALRRRVARQQAALHESQMMGASYSRTSWDWPSLSIWYDKLAGGPTQPVVSLEFQNQDDPYDTWGPYGPKGQAVLLREWTPENIDRLGAAIGELPDLQSISFWRTTLPKGALARLVPSSPKLTYLGLGETDVGDDDVIQVVQRLPNLEHLVLSDTNVTDRTLEAVAGLKRLTTLRLQNTRITDAGLQTLRGLPLRTLDIGLTCVSENSAPLLAKWQLVGEVKLPGEWSQASIVKLQTELPAHSDVQTTTSLTSTPGARALLPLPEGR
jgi:hypothetical protein